MLKDTHKAVLAGMCESVYKGLSVVRCRKLLDCNVDVEHLAHLRACPHRGRLDRHAFLSQGNNAPRQQGKKVGGKGITDKSVFLHEILLDWECDSRTKR